jgi:hypothetical protein
VIQILTQHCSQSLGHKFLHNMGLYELFKILNFFYKAFIISFVTVDHLGLTHQQRVEDAKSREEENAAKV